LHGLVTIIEVFEVELVIFDVVEGLVPFVERLLIDGAEVGVALTAKVSNEVAANETAGAADEDFVHETRRV
jgi:hypothetical protein